MSVMVALTGITQQEARRRYDAGLLIAVANEHYRDGHVGQAITRTDVQGWTFDELTDHSTDRRRPSALYWSRPMIEAPTEEATLTAAPAEAARVRADPPDTDLICGTRYRAIGLVCPEPPGHTTGGCRDEQGSGA